jgi:hypothetical protein
LADVAIVALPGRAVGAATDGATVWCAAGGRLLAFEAAGSPLLDVPAPPRLRGLAAGPDVVVAALEPGLLVWLDPGSASEQLRHPVGGQPELAAGGGTVWALDRRSGRAWRLAGVGAVSEPLCLPSVDRIAADGERIWWTSRDDTLLRGGARPVDIGVGAGERGGMVACAGAVILSVADGLLLVSAWSAEVGPTLTAPEGPGAFLACGDGVLVGASGRRGLFLLDPSVDADVRHFDLDLGGDLDFLVATRSVAWALPAGRAEARLVTVRPGDRHAPGARPDPDR